MIILRFDCLLNILLSEYLFKTKFDTLGHLVIEILLDLSVHLFDFPAFCSFISTVLIKIIYYSCQLFFIADLKVKLLCLSINLASRLIH